MDDNILYANKGKILRMCPKAKEGEYTIVDGTEVIGYAAFQRTYKITKIIIPDSVKTLEAWAFMKSGVSEITIGENVEVIQANCFHSCVNLKKIIINSATIANQITAQNACGYLVEAAETIYIKEDITTIGSYIIDNYSVTTSDKEGYIKYVKN